MNRRGFLGALGAMIGGVVLEQAIPFNRVWSFPTEIKVRTASLQSLATVFYDKAYIEKLESMFRFNQLVTGKPLPISGEMFRMFHYEIN